MACIKMLVIFVKFYTILVKSVMSHSNKSKSQNFALCYNKNIRLTISGKISGQLSGKLPAVIFNQLSYSIFNKENYFSGKYE